ncbi:MAG TPA: hypothetical protein VFI97_05715 [Arthrobacter sp.]|nr:hypothetical protein [Arthrobacter sp.]
MRLWLKARRADIATYSILGTVAVVALFGRQALQVPAVLGGGTVALPVALFAPIIFVGGLNATMACRLRAQERMSARCRGLWDLGLIGGYVALLTGLLATTNTLLDVPGSASLVRNAVALSAVSLAALVTFGPAPAICGAVGLLLITSSYGPAAPYAPHVRFLQASPTDAWSWAVTGTAVVVATGLLLFPRLGVDSD